MADDVSDEELLREIQEEALKALKNDTSNNNIDNLLNDTSSSSSNINNNFTNNNNNNNINNQSNDGNINYDGSSSNQLTTFQDNIITTGSEVSKLLMVILLILFIIQFIRKTYDYFTLQSKIKKVANPLDNAKPIAAENLTPINPGYDHKSYAVYNTGIFNN